MTLEPLPNETYIGTVVGLYCTVWLDSAVDTDVQVTVSITPASEESQSFREANDLGNGAYQSSLVFSPLASGDGSVYVCNVSVQSANEHVVGTTANTAYSLTPLGTMQTVPLTLTRDLCSHIVLFQSSLSLSLQMYQSLQWLFHGTNQQYWVPMALYCAQSTQYPGCSTHQLSPGRTRPLAAERGKWREKGACFGVDFISVQLWWNTEEDTPALPHFCFLTLPSSLCHPPTNTH